MNKKETKGPQTHVSKQKLSSGSNLDLSIGLKAKVHTNLKDDLCSALSKRGNMVHTKEELEALNKVLQQWQDDLYQPNSTPKLPLFAIPLSEKYTDEELDRGRACLKAQDVDLVANLLPITDRTGIVLCLATMEMLKTGNITPYDVDKWTRQLDMGISSCAPEMGRDTKEEIQIYHLVPFGWMSTTTYSASWKGASFNMDPKSLVPKGAFYSLSPDKEYFDGDDLIVEHLYKLSALVFFRKKDDPYIRLSIRGVSKVLEQLKLESSGFTPAAEKTVSLILSRNPGNEVAVEILKHAATHKRHDIWNKAIPFVNGNHIDIIGTVQQGLGVFSYDTIKPGLFALVTEYPELRSRLGAIKDISTAFDASTRTKHVQELQRHANASYELAAVDDVPSLVFCALEQGGIQMLVSEIIPKTSTRHRSCQFHLALAEKLNKEKHKFTQPQRTQLDALIRQCIIISTSDYTNELASQGRDDDTESYETLKRVSEHIDRQIKMCFSLDQLETGSLCVEVFNKAKPAHRGRILTSIKRNIKDCSDQQSGWVNNLMKETISTYSNPTRGDIETVAWIAEQLGPEVLGSAFFLGIQPESDYVAFDFLLGLAESLHKCEEPCTTKPGFHNVILQCLQTAAPRWQGKSNSKNHWTRMSCPSTSQTIDRVVGFVDFCLKIGNLDICAKFFDTISTTITDKHDVEYLLAPLSSRIKQTAQKYGISITTHPLKRLLKNCVSLYLVHVLGSAPRSKTLTLPDKNIDCPNADCKLVVDWILDDMRDYSVEFKESKAARTHIEKCIGKMGLSTLVTHRTTTYGRPLTLVIEKRPELLSSYEWMGRMRSAKEVLKSVVGTDEELKVVMDGRFDDVMLALKGTAAFVVDCEKSIEVGRKRKPSEADLDSGSQRKKK